MPKRFVKFLLSFFILSGLLSIYDVEVTESNALVILLVAVFLPAIFRTVIRLVKKIFAEPKPKTKTQPQPVKTLQVSAPPKPTGQSDFFMLCSSDSAKVKNYVMFDLETTGFNSTLDRIIEIGAIKCINDQPVDSFTTFVNPDMHIPSNVSRLTGITDADVKDAPSFKEIAKPLIEFIGNSPLVAHNANFDARFLRDELNYADITFDFEIVDTLTLARSAFPDFPNHKLSTLSKMLNLADHEQQHRALDDAEIGRQLFIKCKAAWKKRWGKN